MQYVSHAGSSHTEVTSLLLRPFIARSGAGCAVENLGNAFLDLLRDLGEAIADPTTWDFAHDPGLIEAAFPACTFRLALSLFPDRHLPELLGVNLYESVRGPNPIIETLAASRQTHRFVTLWAALQDAVDPPRLALAAIRAHIDEGAHPASAVGARIAKGFAAAFAVDAAERAAILAWACGAAFSPRPQMLALVRRRAASAVGYHARGSLAGRSLDSWFAAAAVDPEPFLDALAQSPWIVPGDSASSALLRDLASSRGPMAGIFTRAEATIIARWINSLPDGATAAVQALEPLSPPVPGVGLPEPAHSYADLPIRELYHCMVRIEDHPGALPHAKKFASAWLARAGRIRPGDPRPLPFDRYSHAAIEAWLDEQHHRQVAGFDFRSDEPTVSREALVESSIQLCPAVLIDGAWVQRFSAVSLCATDVGARLFRIYLDEVGDGSPADNHPNVYRELMASMGIELPPVGSRDFAMWPGFIDVSFQLPTFWMCISQFPRHFLPEILGLNLAIELSGVGGTYRSTSRALRHYGYDSFFVDLHNTVDNVSTGHTAIALRAVVAHMDDVLQHGGRPEVERRWQRVWTGYRALAAGPSI